MSRVTEKIKADAASYTDSALATLENRMRRSQQAMQFWPQVLTVPLTIPEGQQLVLDFLTIGEGVTLTVNGHLRVLSWLHNYGHIQVGAMGSLRRG
jgi:hypothetical protein